MGAVVDLTGRTFGRLRVIARAEGNSKANKSRWHCVCECGGEPICIGGNLVSGTTKSCGCHNSEVASRRMAAASRRHGHTSRSGPSLTYSSWLSMHNRCKHPCVRGYEYYGGRGIRVCERWGAFENFLADMGERPTSKHSIDRIDVEGHYEPSNCRWATASEQARNKRKRQA